MIFFSLDAFWSFDKLAKCSWKSLQIHGDSAMKIYSYQTSQGHTRRTLNANFSQSEIIEGKGPRSLIWYTAARNNRYAIGTDIE